MRYKIVGDSCCDYSDCQEDLSFIQRVPLILELDNQQYLDNETLSTESFLKKMEASENAPKSACPSVGAYMEAFEGAEEVYVVTLSEKVSGSYNCACTAAELYLAAKGRARHRIHVFNSKSAAAGQIAICLKLWELCEADLTFEEVVRKTEEFIASMKTFFLLETLDVFRKNGRLSHLQALVTDTLKIKLIMGADAEGAIEMKGKALTFQIALRKMADQIKKLCGDGAKDRVLCITHCQCRERAQKVVELIREAGFKKAVICAAGGISTMYANKGGLIVAF